jgi:hypothetical protein
MCRSPEQVHQTTRKIQAAVSTDVQVVDVTLKLLDCPPAMCRLSYGDITVQAGAYMEESTIVSNPSLVL